MNKKAIFNHFSKILDNMIKDSLFFDTYLQRPFYLDDEFFDGENDDLPDNIEVKTGVTRCCIIDRDYDYVVKFDIEEDDYGSGCEREERFYNSACNEGLQDYFAEALYLGDYKKTFFFYNEEEVDRETAYFGVEGFEESFLRAEREGRLGEIEEIEINIPLFAYPRARAYVARIVTDEEESSKEISSIKSPLSKRNRCIAADFIKEYGFEEYKRFSDFSISQGINDVHTNNVGYINGRLVLIDYAGFHEIDDDSDFSTEEESDDNSY